MLDHRTINLTMHFLEQQLRAQEIAPLFPLKGLQNITFGDAAEMYPDLEPLEAFFQDYTLLGVGRSRATFRLDDTHVIKVPHNPDGVDANEREALHYLLGCPHTPLAPCHLAEVLGWEVLVMEQVLPELHLAKDSSPFWVKFVDCQQVGYRRNGELVAYDL